MLARMLAGICRLDAEGGPKRVIANRPLHILDLQLVWSDSQAVWPERVEYHGLNGPARKLDMSSLLRQQKALSFATGLVTAGAGYVATQVSTTIPTFRCRHSSFQQAR